ncbi:MAG: hypothetical protein JRN15_15140 [Nitrososphaerota archaeon]|nr:hypothetical protein [Nitrososphaerota archaeon]
MEESEIRPIIDRILRESNPYLARSAHGAAIANKEIHIQVAVDLIQGRTESEIIEDLQDSYSDETCQRYLEHGKKLFGKLKRLAPELFGKSVRNITPDKRALSEKRKSFADNRKRDSKGRFLKPASEEKVESESEIVIVETQDEIPPDAQSGSVKEVSTT